MAEPSGVPEPARDLVGFVAELRRHGVHVGQGRTIEFCRAATLVEPRDLYWSGRLTLIGRAEDLPRYDKAFVTYFARLPEQAESRNEQEEAYPGGPSDLVSGGDDSTEEEGLASEVELLAHKDFAELSEAELAKVAALIERLRLRVPPRRVRRWRRAPSGPIDLRRTVRRALRQGGEAVELRRRRRVRKPRRLILLIDVSHSMRDYARSLLVFAHSALRGRHPMEVFCFGTRLTRLTRVLSTSSVETALAAAADRVLDWDGGTRIGPSLKTFLDTFGRAGPARGAIVVLCSDGLEQGDPAVLGSQMERLSRLAHRIIWLNPLKGGLDYQPLARGMRAALPHIDVFSSGHNFASLEHLAEVLSEAGGSRSGDRPRRNLD